MKRKATDSTVARSSLRLEKTPDRPRNAPNNLPAAGPAATAARATASHDPSNGNPVTSEDLFHNLQLLEHYILIVQWLPGQDWPRDYKAWPGRWLRQS